jgi:hypothetical protein
VNKTEQKQTTRINLCAGAKTSIRHMSQIATDRPDPYLPPTLPTLPTRRPRDQLCTSLRPLPSPVILAHSPSQNLTLYICPNPLPINLPTLAPTAPLYPPTLSHSPLVLLRGTGSKRHVPGSVGSGSWSSAHPGSALGPGPSALVGWHLQEKEKKKPNPQPPSTSTTCAGTSKSERGIAGRIVPQLLKT